MGGVLPGDQRVAVLPAVLVDTNVFSALLRTPHGGLADRYARFLAGPLLHIATQTLAELRYGALVRGWGEKRVAEFEHSIARAAVLPVDDALVLAHARLRFDCRRLGHPLHQAVHDADLWVAASALAYGLPLVSDDSIFEDVPGLELIREPT